MRKQALQVVLLCFMLLQVTDNYAQSFDLEKNYQPLLSSGKLPRHLTTPSSKKYQNQLSRIHKNDNRSAKKAKKEFFLESNFLIDDLLKSGYILYNDPLSNYINKVADIVLKEDPSLRKKLKFHVFRSTEVNAFTTDQGIIFVSMGLLSQLENESQLAFVLCHEIIHYQHKHGLDLFMEVKHDDESTSEKSVFGRKNINENLFRFSYAKSLELEADDEGLDLYLKTDYDLKAINEVFNILAYSYLPFEDIKFKKSFFEQPYFTFPNNYQMDKVKPISLEISDNDKRSTHPSIGKRKAALHNKIIKHLHQEKKSFIIPERYFRKAQQIARFENVFLNLSQEQYYQAIYDSYVLLADYPDNLYLKKGIAKALYLVSKFRNQDYNFNIEIEDFEGEFQGVVHFMEQLNSKELNAFAANYSWQLFKAHPEDEELSQIATDVLTELILWHKIKLSDLKEYNPSQKSSTSTNTSTKEKTKMEKIRMAAASSKVNYWQYALSPFLNQSTFQSNWTIAEKEAKYWRNVIENSKKQKKKKLFAKKSKKEVRLGVEKIVLVNPHYVKIDSRKENTVLYEKGEKAQTNFHNLLKENAKLTGLKTVTLDVEKIKTSDAEMLNDISLLTEWFQNQRNYKGLTITPGIRQKEINEIAKKYGTKYFCWTGVISLKQRKPNGWYLSAFVPFAWPIAVSYLFKSFYECLYYNCIYNVETGGFEMVKYEYLFTKDKDDVLNLHIYDAFLQIHSK